MADDPLTKTLNDQAIELDRIIKEAQRLSEEINSHIETLRKLRADTMRNKPRVERRKRPR